MCRHCRPQPVQVVCPSLVVLWTSNPQKGDDVTVMTVTHHITYRLWPWNIVVSKTDSLFSSRTLTWNIYLLSLLVCILWFDEVLQLCTYLFSYIHTVPYYRISPFVLFSFLRRINTSVWQRSNLTPQTGTYLGSCHIFYIFIKTRRICKSICMITISFPKKENCLCSRLLIGWPKRIYYPNILFSIFGAF